MKKISFKNVTKNFKANFWEKSFLALDNVSFSLGEGDLIGYLGANGAGKTTSIKALMGFISIDQGNISYEGFKQATHQDFLKHVGYLPEKTYLYQHLTGREFLEYIGAIFKIKRADLNSRISKWSVRLVIDHALDRKIHTYSKGMQQRLSFISALINEPDILVLDEPLSGLDPIGRKDFKTIFKELNQERGTTVFFSSHVVSDVEEICNNVLFIEKGKIIYQGAIDKLIHENAKDEFKIKYFDKDELKVVKVEMKNKDTVLMNLISSGYNIIEIEKDCPTLESIIYQVNTNE